MCSTRATGLLEDLLARVDAGSRYLDCVSEVWVFGFVHGALEPHDVDLDIELAPDEEFRAFQVRCLAYGGDWLALLHREVTARRRGLQVFYDRRQMYEKKSIELTLLWRRGEPIATALSRLYALKPDSDAGRAHRDASARNEIRTLLTRRRTAHTVVFGGSTVRRWRSRRCRRATTPPPSTCREYRPGVQATRP